MVRALLLPLSLLSVACSSLPDEVAEGGLEAGAKETCPATPEISIEAYVHGQSSRAVPVPVGNGLPLPMLWEEGSSAISKVIWSVSADSSDYWHSVRGSYQGVPMFEVSSRGFMDVSDEVAPCALRYSDYVGVPAEYVELVDAGELDLVFSMWPNEGSEEDATVLEITTSGLDLFPFERE